QLPVPRRPEGEAPPRLLEPGVHPLSLRVRRPLLASALSDLLEQLGQVAVDTDQPPDFVGVGARELLAVDHGRGVGSMGAGGKFHDINHIRISPAAPRNLTARAFADTVALPAVACVQIALAV